MSDRILVFGSNEAGIHGAGAAAVAYKKYRARWGMSYGHYGSSFAIPTKDQSIRKLPLARVGSYVSGFIAYAQGHPEMEFQVTKIGCGLAGFEHWEIAPMFKMAPFNCLFDDEWNFFLGDHFKYWGTYP